ncbi:MAG: hypothetical protein J6Z04_08140 [Clostridia bacterium]|nr:hypothetical protein [Clostridia bacterium]
MHNNAKRRGLSFLLILAMLFVSVAVMLPVATSADPVEFADFGVQKLAALNLAGDEDTDLRFVFTVGSLDYTEVGFVFSKTNAAPTVGGDACYKMPVTVVHTQIVADGNTLTADPGRYWVAVKMTDIPHSYFDGALYVRPFVTDGLGTRYADAALTSVCDAAGHVHTIDEFEHERTGGTAALDVAGTIVGNCPGCNLEVTFNDVKAGVEYQKWIGGGGQARMYDRRQISDILAGGKHFYPDASNGGLGNDLVVEYSILWNETLLNLSADYNDGARLLTTFDTTNGGFSGEYRAIAYASLTNNVKDSGANFAGAFEYPSGLIQTSEPGDPHPGMTAGGGAYSDYANVGGTDRDHPEWGWHRIGVIYHEDVTNLNAVKGGAAATYKLTVSIYIDGVLVSILSGDHLDRGNADYKLFTATCDGNGGVTYEDIDEDIWVFAFLVHYVTAPTADAWFADGDVFVTAGHDFVHPVTRIANPAARTETVGGQDFNGAFYYTSAGAHDHVWGSLVNDASHAADCGHAATQSIHCTICGAVKPDSTVNLPIDPSLHNWGVTPVRIQEPTLLEDGIDRYTCTVCSATDDRAVSYEHSVQIFTTSTSGAYSPNGATVGSIRGSKHFYDEGNDLMVEFSILWNESLTHLRDDNSDNYKPYMDSRFATNAAGTSGNNNIVYWSLTGNIKGSDCKFPGGFEWGGIAGDPGDNPYPRFAGAYNDITAYPNLGGYNNGDGTAQVNDLYGWHRVSIRYHEEVTNVAAVKSGSAASYLNEMWVYIDGDLVLHTAETKAISKQLFTATGGGGSITYTENDSYYFHGAFLNSTRMKTGTGYFEIADYSATIGSDFVQNVRRVNNPTPTTLEVENGVFIPSTMWYELDN